MNRLELKTKLTFKDYLEIESKIVFKRVFSLNNTHSLMRIFAFLIPTFVMIRIILGRDDYIGYFIIAIAINLTFLIVDLIETKIYGKQFIQSHSIYSKERLKVITAEGISEFYKGAELFSEWDEYKRMYESKNVFKMYKTNGQYVYVSKSDFENEEQLAFFKECTANIKKG